MNIKSVQFGVHNSSKPIIRVAASNSHARLPNVVQVEVWPDWVPDDERLRDQAEVRREEGDLQQLHVLAEREHHLQYVVHAFGDKLVFEGEVVVGRVLVEGIDPAVSNQNARQVEALELVLVEVGGDAGDVVAGVALPRQVHLPTLELFVLVQEALHEVQEILGNLLLTRPETLQSCGEAHASAHWLVHKHQVGFVVP